MNDILEGLEISDSQENTNEINDDPDRNALRKKYLLRLDELSFKFRIWTHPFRLLQTMLILAFLTFVAYIFRNHNCINDAYKLLHSFALMSCLYIIVAPAQLSNKFLFCSFSSAFSFSRVVISSLSSLIYCIF